MNKVFVCLFKNHLNKVQTETWTGGHKQEKVTRSIISSFNSLGQKLISQSTLQMAHEGEKYHKYVDLPFI